MTIFPSDRTMAPGSTQPLVKMSTKYIPGGKGGRCVRLTSPPSRAECHEIWAPKTSGTLWATPGMLRDSFTFNFTHCTGAWVGSRTSLDGCGESRPHRDSIHVPPTRSESLYRLRNPGPHFPIIQLNFIHGSPYSIQTRNKHILLLYSCGGTKYSIRTHTGTA